MRKNRSTLIVALCAAGLVILAFLFVREPIIRGQDERRSEPVTPVTLSDTGVGGLRYAARLVPKRDLTLEAVSLAARRFTEGLGTIRYAELFLAHDRADVDMSFYGVASGTDSTLNFSTVLSKLSPLPFGHGALPENAVARVLFVNGSTLISLREPGLARNSKAGVRELLLSGDTDPTMAKVSNGSFRLLKVATDGPDDSFLIFFFKSLGEPSCNACMALAKLQMQRFAARSVQLHVRRDTWFAQARFPAVYRFEPDTVQVNYILNGYVPEGLLVAPNITEFYRGPDVTCSAVSCEYYGLRERIPQTAPLAQSR